MGLSPKSSNSQPVEDDHKTETDMSVDVTYEIQRYTESFCNVSYRSYQDIDSPGNELLRSRF